MAIEEEIISILTEKFDITEDEINLETNFEKDLGADSLDTVELQMEVEEKYNLEIEDEDVKNLVTVGDFINYVKEHYKQE